MKKNDKYYNTVSCASSLLITFCTKSKNKLRRTRYIQFYFNKNGILDLFSIFCLLLLLLLLSILIIINILLSLFYRQFQRTFLFVRLFYYYISEICDFFLYFRLFHGSLNINKLKQRITNSNNHFFFSATSNKSLSAVLKKKKGWLIREHRI